MTTLQQRPGDDGSFALSPPPRWKQQKAKDLAKDLTKGLSHRGRWGSYGSIGNLGFVPASF
jgi:hypothetical protein